MSVVALRTALVWHDEVMDDVVSEKPQRISVGQSGRATFVVPDIGLPPDFAIVRPGNRGYLLTLGDRMRGTICIDGTERDVEEFVRRGAEGGADTGSFRATPISGRDWGVIELDESGDYKLFFQFVPLDEAPQFFTPKVISAGLAGFVISATTLAILWMANDTSAADAFTNGSLISLGAILAGGCLRWLYVQDGETQASWAFSVILHIALLFATYQLYDPNDSWSWPGPRGMTGEYLALRAQAEPPPPPPPTVSSSSQASEAAASSPTKKNTHTATKGETGASGGKGDTERARNPNPTDDNRPPPPDKGVMTGNNRAAITNVIDRDLTKTLGRFAGIQGDRVIAGSVGFGPGAGTGVGAGDGTGTTRGGKGKGPGGGGNAEGDFVTNRGKIDTGTDRPGGNCKGTGCTGSGPKEVKVALADPGGDLGGYTEDEINRVVKSRAGVFKVCYQKELNRSPGLGGKLVVKFKIGSDGSVLSAAATGGSTLTNAAVSDCVTSNVARLHFPAKGVVANVTYPFVFTQGG